MSEEREQAPSDALFQDWYGRTRALPDGHPVRLRVSTYAIAVYDNRILLVRSSRHGRWEAPGGGLHGLESPAEAMVRELAEETKCNVAAARLELLDVGATAFVIGERFHHSVNVYYGLRLEEEPVQHLRAEDHHIADSALHPISQVPALKLNELMRPKLLELMNRFV